MRLDLKTRTAGSGAITLGLIWAFTSTTAWLPLVALGSGMIFYIVGVIGAFQNIREKVVYFITLLGISFISALLSLIILILVGLSLIDTIGVLIFWVLLYWFYQTPLRAIRSR